MNMRKITLLGILFSIAVSVTAQETTWEPQTNITGYGTLQWDYFKGVKTFDREYAIALSEAGILVNYKPTERLTLKTVFVYRPDYAFNQMLNEANAEYKVTDFLNLKGGRFLTPVSPMNTYYYAPVNVSATLPMIVTSHEFFPLNMNAVSVNGKVGDDLKFDYDVFTGGFYNSAWLKAGALGLFGTETSYFQSLFNPLNTALNSDVNSSLSFGGGAHVGLAVKEYATLGLNLMKATTTAKTTIPLPTGGTYLYTSNVDFTTTGASLKLKYSNLALTSEYWQNKLTAKSYNLTLKGLYTELSYAIGKVTPYGRYEFQESLDIDYKRYTVGINYKPVFETTFKLEYLHYDCKTVDLDGFVAAFIYSF